MAGTLIGNITASEEVNLIQNGKVLGNISTPRLNVEKRRHHRGEGDHHQRAPDSVGKLIQEAFGEDADSFFGAGEDRPQGKGRERTRNPKRE